MGIDEELTQEIVRQILTVTKPERIIMFGSAATGTMTRDSDIDLLVLEPAPGNQLQERVRIRRSLADIEMPFDIFVMPTERFESTKTTVGGLAYPANKYGRVIYDAA